MANKEKIGEMLEIINSSRMNVNKTKNVQKQRIGKVVSIDACKAIT